MGVAASYCGGGFATNNTMVLFTKLEKKKDMKILALTCIQISATVGFKSWQF